MHSFENGASLRVKADNWSQLARLFLRAIPRVRLTDAVAEGVMRGAPGYAVDLIESLYVAFTLKELPPMAPLMRDESYAGPLVSGGGGGGGNGRSRFSPGTGGGSGGSSPASDGGGGARGSPRRVGRMGEGPLAVRFEGIETLPQETAAQARASHRRRSLAGSWRRCLSTRCAQGSSLELNPT